MKHRLRSTALSLTFITAASTTLADENLWLYTRGVETRPDNSLELKLQTISRIGKNSGDYIFNDVRPEFEYGITDRWTIGAQLMVFNHQYSDVQWAPMVDTQGGEGGSFDKTQIGGFQITNKFNILSPFKNFIGLALGFTYDHRYAYRLDGAEITQDSYIPRLFIQKNFLDDTFTWSFSGALEMERRESPGVLEEEFAWDLATGVSYRVAPNWTVGLEARWQSDFLTPVFDGEEPEGKTSNWDLDDIRVGDQFQWGLYVGPSVHYAGRKWWLTLGALYQVAGWSADGPAASSQGRNWDEHERFHVGFILGFEFGGVKKLEDMASSGKSPAMVSQK